MGHLPLASELPGPSPQGPDAALAQPTVVSEAGSPMASADFLAYSLATHLFKN